MNKYTNKIKKETDDEKLNSFIKKLVVFDPHERIIFGFTKDGLKKDADQAGQDNYDIISSELGQNIYYFAAYDGHDIKGREASKFTKDEIHKYLIKEKYSSQHYKKEKKPKIF